MIVMRSERPIHGFNRLYDYNLSLQMNTTDLYGMYKPLFMKSKELPDCVTSLLRPSATPIRRTFGKSHVTAITTPMLIRMKTVRVRVP